MIRYSLKCANGHGFDSWFQSAEGFEKLQSARMVTCAECGSSAVSKSIMAPSVAKGGAPEAHEKHRDARQSIDKQAEIAKLKAHIEANSDYVGMNFAKEARAIHDGTAPERSIFGEAKPEDAKALIEEGIPVAPLPFMPTRKTN